MPDFNSSSVFAGILDKDRGGSFSIITEEGTDISQAYISKTNILQTSFKKGSDIFYVFDFMPRYINGDHRYYNPPDIIRYVQLVSGKPKIRVKYDPRLEYGVRKTKSECRADYIKSFTTSGVYDSLYLYTDLDKQKVLDGEEIELTGDAYFLLSYNQKLLQQSIERPS